MIWRAAAPILVLVLAGCTASSPAGPKLEFRVVQVYVENDGASDLHFAITLGGLVAVTQDVPHSGSTPNVRRAPNVTLGPYSEGPPTTVLVDVEESTLNLSWRHELPLFPDVNALIVNAYPNATLDVWMLDREPRFD